MDSQNSSLGTNRKLFIAPGSLARERGKIIRHLGLSGQNHVSGSIEREPSLVNTCNNDMQYAFEQVDHVEDSQAQMESNQDEICEVVREDSSLSNIQLVEKCFGPQRHDYVFGHGGGVRPKDVRGPIASKQELHHENVTLREKMNNMESEFKAFKGLMMKNLPPNVQVTASTSNTSEGAPAIGEEQ
ncbi:hypothetical protein ZIOFF_005291 [Zingiber officinale]|uniref:Uncharacterized protein n=1 Tax=Zingiber officinale TaxID=94328 RepID=A0A8J5LRK9_ZINOF|nr:hypothetical protein ZIOFF_005291 [Zingiber officinale]